jgi:hypothetical protein
VEGPVPLNDEGPPGVPLGLPPCANARVPDTANAEANTIVVSFMVDSLLLDKESGPQSCRAMLHWSHGMIDVSKAIVHCPKGQ